MVGAPENRGTGRVLEVWSRRKWLAAVVFLGTAAVGMAVARTVPDVYQATATVLVEEPRAEGAVSWDLDRRLQVITQEILSRSRLEKLIYALNLYPALRAHASPDGLVDRLRRDIRTEFKAPPLAGNPGTTLAFSLSYKGSRPETTARVANSLASFYLEEDAKIRSRQASEAVRLLKSQLDEMQGKLQDQQQKLSAYQQDHPEELPQQAEINMAALERLHADLRSTSDERMRAMDRRNDLLRRLADLDTAMPSAPGAAAPEAPTRVARLKDELADLQRRYSDKYPDVIRLRREIAAAEGQPTEVKPEHAAPEAATPVQGRATTRLNTELAEVEAEIAKFKSDESGLRDEIAGHIQRLESAPRRQQAYQDLSRDYQTTRDLYDSLRQRYEQAQLAEGVEGTTAGPRFRILDPATVPSDPVAPNRMMLMAMTLIAALAAAAAAMALAEKLDTSFHAADDVGSFTRVPVLASIPLLETTGDRRRQRLRFGIAAVAVLLGLGLVVQAVRGVARSEEGIVAALVRGRS